MKKLLLLLALFALAQFTSAQSVVLIQPPPGWPAGTPYPGLPGIDLARVPTRNPDFHIGPPSPRLDLFPPPVVFTAPPPALMARPAGVGSAKAGLLPDDILAARDAAKNVVELRQSGQESIGVLVASKSHTDAIQAATSEIRAAGGNLYAAAINNGGVARAQPKLVVAEGRLILK
ncbi:MAG: hypothetical protein AB1705_23640 [Verrucomicrobiota bacterium]